MSLYLVLVVDDEVVPPTAFGPFGSDEELFVERKRLRGILEDNRLEDLLFRLRIVEGVPVFSTF